MHRVPHGSAPRLSTGVDKSALRIGAPLLGVVAEADGATVRQARRAAAAAFPAAFAFPRGFALALLPALSAPGPVLLGTALTAAAVVGGRCSLRARRLERERRDEGATFVSMSSRAVLRASTNVEPSRMRSIALTRMAISYPMMIFQLGAQTPSVPPTPRTWLPNKYST